MADTARTSVTLADGRELIYFDDAPWLDRTAPDRRVLPPSDPRPEVRFDPVTGEHIVIAAHRQTRTFLPTADAAARAACPLCPGHAESEVPADGYHVAIFENRFPSLGGPAGGRCEVVCFTDDHDATFAGLPPARLATVARAFADRTRELGARPDVEEVFVFENRGAEIGATLSHPHGQIYAFPYLTPRTRRALAHDRCVFCEVVKREADGERVIAETANFIAFVPYAARWPYQAQIVPREHVPDITALGEDAATELMGLYADVLGRFGRLYDKDVPYMAGWHQAPPAAARDRAHLWVEVYTPQRTADKLKYLASVETGTGAFLNDVRPEDAAERLRTV
ncbi:galactose-1-phosphate uridylyltransferase [Actinomadura logoneensis]|uniref:Galactose-1-phosphate uridylyltransferase n=1 Tax=Actinomadura logoneensis TaxID=2293572 RepID=A0A372JE82_9ACTN|nr:galactose-1-phosphate uridylyltransferase [Actinomadura logoneensis]RFU38315.1 galactose-1-phosphate uridylyltransferase [Actinomadura logoneensis]